MNQCKLLEEEKKRNLVEYENALYHKDIKYIAGVDEVGRGPLAGPVVACAVVLNPEIWGLSSDSNADFNFLLSSVDDSKKLTEKKREALFEVIKSASLAYGFGLVDHEKIDEINILEATKLAMKLAIEDCNLMLLRQPEPMQASLSRTSSANSNSNLAIDHVLIDALKLPAVNIPQTAIIKGDSLSLSIAAASILAKVTRDRLMLEYHKAYPDYAFDRNKGYGTKAHYEGLHKVGLSPIHRRSFVHL